MKTIHVLRKPCSEGTVVANVLRWGTGAINVDGCRVGLAKNEDVDTLTARSGGERGIKPDGYVAGSGARTPNLGWDCSKGRWPANVLFTHAPGCGDECAPGCPVAGLDEQSGVSTSTGGRTSVGAFKGGRAFGVGNGAEVLPGVQPGLGDTGGASRFFKQFVGSVRSEDR